VHRYIGTCQRSPRGWYGHAIVGHKSVGQYVCTRETRAQCLRAWRLLRKVD